MTPISKKSTTLQIQLHKHLRINIILFSLLVVFIVSPVFAEQWQTVIDSGNSSGNSSSSIRNSQEHQNIIDDKRSYLLEKVASFTGSKVEVPGATILYRGQITNNEMPVSLYDNPLLAISYENRIYFYHPAAGEAELSEKTNRLSLLYFFLGEGLTGPSASAADRDRQEGLLNVQILNPWDDKILDDIGFRVNVGEISGSRKCTMEASNICRRWAAVKKTGPATQVTYFAPRANILPKNLADVFYRKWVAQGDRSFAYFLVTGQTSSFDFYPPQQFELLGAGWKSLLFPLCFPKKQYIPYEHKNILANLDDLGLKFSLISIIQDLLGIIPCECSDVVVNIAALSLTDMWLAAYKKPGNLAMVRDYLGKSGLMDVCYSLFSCVYTQLALKGSPKFKAKLELFNTIWDALNLLGTLAGELVGTNVIQSQKIRYKKIEVVVEKTLSVTVATDKGAYKTSDTAIFSGFVRVEGKAVEGASVKIVVKSASTPDQETLPDKIWWIVKTDAEGRYTKKYTLTLPRGNYVVQACAALPGYKKGCNSTRFSISEAVIPGMVEKWYVFHTCKTPTTYACVLELRKTTKNWLENRAKRFGWKLTIVHSYNTRKEAIKTTCAQLTDCNPASSQGLRNHAIARLGGSLFNVREFMSSKCKCHPVE